MEEKLTVMDRKLIATARKLISRRYDGDRHHIGSALITDRGNIFTGVHVEASVGRIALCAEAVAIGRMRTDSSDMVKTIVAVRSPGKGSPLGKIEIVSPCGMCRELICDYGKGAKLILREDGVVRKVDAEALLPSRFMPADHGL